MKKPMVAPKKKEVAMKPPAMTSMQKGGKKKMC